jgi:hypothetical protein
MRQRTLRRLEVLEEGYHSREHKKLSAAETAGVYIWIVVLGYYLGDLESDDGLELDEDDPRPGEAHARALKYESNDDYWKTLFKAVYRNDIEAHLELDDRYNDAYRRLFAKVELDFEKTPRNVLFDALVRMVDRLPDHWLNWLRSNLQRWAADAEIAVGSNVPRRLSGDNAFPFAREPRRPQNSTRKK